MFEYGEYSFTHIFDCYAKIHSWEFTENEVLLSAQFLHSHFYNESLEAGDLYPAVYFGVEDPRFNTEVRTEAMINSVPSD
jgi:hypothetical protein